MTEISHPAHYTQGSVECIEAIEAMLTRQQFKAYCRAQAAKYIWRSPWKGTPSQDIRKAIWYLEACALREESDVLDDLVREGQAMGDYRG